MRLLVPVIIGLVLLIGGAQAYLITIECPAEIQVGVPLVVTGNATFPAGTQFDIVFSFSEYTQSEIARQRVALSSDKSFMVAFPTTGLEGGQYKVEVRFDKDPGSSLGSSSTTVRVVQLIDRQDEITFTAPVHQETGTALLIDGSLRKFGTNGVHIEVTGPSGVIFSAYIPTQIRMGKDDGYFRKEIPVQEPGNYAVAFSDSKGYIGQVTIVVTRPAVTMAATTTPATAVSPTIVIPATTQSPPATQNPVTTRAPLTTLAVIIGISSAAILIVRRNI